MKQIDLTNPNDCRWYCANFEVPGKGKVSFVQLSSGRRVDFHSMSDEDAVLVANELYQMEIRGEHRAKGRIIDEGGRVH